MNELKKLKQEIEYLKEENKYYKELLISNKINFNPFVYTEKNEQLSTEEKTKEDKKSYSVIIRGVSKSEIDYYICSMLNDEVITMDDLVDFSEEFKNRISFLINR